MKFEQFHVGQIIEAGPFHVVEADILAFAKSFDPQWFHTDPEAAKSSAFGGLIASGWHTCAIAMRLITDAVLHGSESYASPGMKYIQWPHPVRPGDELRMRAEVLEVRRSSKRPELGVLKWRWSMSNQAGDLVLQLEATSLFDLTMKLPAD